MVVGVEESYGDGAGPGTMGKTGSPQAGGHAMPALPTVHFGLCAQLLPVLDPEEVAALLEHQEHHSEGL